MLWTQQSEYICSVGMRQFVKWDTHVKLAKFCCIKKGKTQRRTVNPSSDSANFCTTLFSYVIQKTAYILISKLTTQSNTGKNKNKDYGQQTWTAIDIGLIQNYKYNRVRSLEGALHTPHPFWKLLIHSKQKAWPQRNTWDGRRSMQIVHWIGSWSS